MNKKTAPIFLFLFLFCSLLLINCTEDNSCKAPVQTNLMDIKVKGMTLVAAQEPTQNDPIADLLNLGVDWVAAIPYAFYIPGNPYIDTMSTCPEPICVYGPETYRAALAVCKSAHHQGMKVMLKPQLWANNQWIGEMTFDTEAQWDAFEVNYTNFILYWAQQAANHHVELFCIGTEIKEFVIHRPNYWRALIPQIEQIYTGKLTYAANWDDYQLVEFWDLLDYIGVDAYFPLNPKETPSVCELKEDWQPVVDELETYAISTFKPILFTEFGYLSMNCTAFNTWELEHKKGTMPINEQAQYNAIQALLETFSSKSWWYGGFQWKWYADAISASCEEDVSKDYTPEDKMAADLLKTMYQ